MNDSFGSLVGEARRVDRELGIEERAGFFGPGSDQLFGVLHRPLTEDAIGGVVVCSSVYLDCVPARRVEVGVARRLAARGYAVFRFEYRGFGHSDGDPAQVTLRSLVDDGDAATQRLRDAGGVDRVGFLGTRLGSLVAASLASRVGAAPLAFWDPVVSSRGFFRDYFRAQVVRTGVLHQRKSPQADADQPSVTTRMLAENIVEFGVTDVLGFPIYRPFYDSVSEVSLADRLQGGNPVFIAHGPAKTGSVERLADAWRGRGSEVTVHKEPGFVDGWFLSRDALHVDDVIAATADWFGRRLAETTV